jgi:beta-mannosidase
MCPDLLADASWTCCPTAPGAVDGPAGLETVTAEWMVAPVPGTAAAAVRAASGWRYADTVDFDASDWWFRCPVPSTGPGRWTLSLEGLATVADVWFAGAHVLHSENMFVPRAIDVGPVTAGDELVIRFAALAPLLRVKRPRPRWKTQMANHQALRWFRTTYLGRQPGWAVTPAPVGPWRPVRLEPSDGVRVTQRRVAASVDSDDTGTVSVAVRLTGVADPGAGAVLTVRRRGGENAVAVDGALAVRVEGEAVVVEGELLVAAVERWWPHTHGSQPLYDVDLTMGADTVVLGHVGFRTVEVDRGDGGFTLAVNGSPVFCRGACWWPVDPVRLHASDEDVRTTLELVAAAHMNMVRIPGGTVYEDDRFWDRCDELGIMVWQDCMLGYTDPPEDEAFEAALVEELGAVFGGLGGRPALAVVCGGQEIEEQAAMFGLTREKWTSTLTQKTIPALCAEHLGAVPYVTSSPTGGDLPFQPDAGDCHYWGVGSYLRRPEDARLSGIRFMSEGMGFAIPPERQTVDDECGGAVRAGHDQRWKQALHHDTGRSWDLEDVRDFYVQQLFGLDPHLLRYLDPERALDLGRAAVAELFARTFSEWRRPGSSCAGGLGVALRDLVPGAGWGFIDALGRPKAPWYALRRVLAPVAVLVIDEGLNGLHLHLVNDSDTNVAGQVTVALFSRGETPVEEVTRSVDIAARGSLVVEAGAMFDGFRDLSYSHRFGPPAMDVVAVRLSDTDSAVTSEAVHLPTGLERPFESEVGLAATARQGADGQWSVSVTTRRFAQWVVVEVPGWRPSDSWFHLAPGASRTVALVREAGSAAGAPSGLVRALNAQATARIIVS